MGSRCCEITARMPRTRLMVIGGVLVLFFLTATTGFGGEIDYAHNRGLGTLQIVSQSPAQSLRLTLPMLIPGDIKPGWGIDIHATWTNVWASESTFLLDYEMLDTIIAATYGFNNRLGLSVAFDNRNYFGGVMDNCIQEFHDMFNIDQDGRDEVPKNRKVVQRFDPQTGDTIEFSADELNNNGVALLLNYNITHGTQTWPSLNAFGVARYALNSAEIFNHGNHQVDCGFGLGFAKRWSKRWYTYAALGYTIFDDYEVRATEPDLEPLEFEDYQFTGMFSLSWHYTPTFAIVAQYLFSGPDIRNIDKLDDPSHEVHLGFKWHSQHYGMIEFALIENVITWNNTPDFGLHAGWSYVF
jgi:signal peptidase I